jgi:release factor glutamine methyltransferase
MPASAPPPLTEPDVVAALRAAGCVFAEDEARLLIEAAGSPAQLADLVEQRAAGVPLEHLLGWAEFCGLRIAVDPGVFVPRRRTEFLVRQAVATLDGIAAPVVVDLCCGSGAVAVAVAAAVPVAQVHGTDVDPVAVRCARRNLEPIGGQVHEGDLFDPLPETLRGQVDVLVANLPYVPTDEIRLMPPEARDHEARVALDGGPDGLDLLRRVAAQAGPWLVPGGRLLIEVSESQIPAALADLVAGGLAAHAVDSAEFETSVVIGTRPALVELPDPAGPG